MKFEITAQEDGWRMDRLLSSRIADISRTRLQRYIKDGRIMLNSVPVTVPRTAVRKGDAIEIHVPEPEPTELGPEDIPLDIVYEDRHIIVINKPAGMVVHPGAGHETGTLVHALLHHCGDLAGIGDVLRPGIVHRLDRDTSGLIIVAKDSKAHQSLTEQFAARTTAKRYMAIVAGKLQDLSGTIETTIGRHPKQRKKMAAGTPTGKNAITQWKKVEELRGASLLDIRIHTGRTHQIRVHMASVGHPLIGDRLYGGHAMIKLNDRTVQVERQMLHAAELSVTHPVTCKRMNWHAPLPEDMRCVIDELHRD